MAQVRFEKHIKKEIMGKNGFTYTRNSNMWEIERDLNSHLQRNNHNYEKVHWVFECQKQYNFGFLTRVLQRGMNA